MPLSMQKFLVDLDKLLEENKNAFAQDETQIGTTPLIEMSIDTGDHPPIAKRPYDLALKHYDGQEKKLINYWKQVLLEKVIQVGLHL